MLTAVNGLTPLCGIDGHAFDGLSVSSCGFVGTALTDLIAPELHHVSAGRGLVKNPTVEWDAHSS
jgi:hypothetical protein